eukprot:991573-Amphidinium_carterae.1
MFELTIDHARSVLVDAKCPIVHTSVLVYHPRLCAQTAKCFCSFLAVAHPLARTSGPHMVVGQIPCYLRAQDEPEGPSTCLHEALA